MTIQQLLEYLYLQLAEALGEEGKENKDRINGICGTISLVYDAAEHHKDWKVTTICDDFFYISNHIEVARWKSDAQMPALKVLIEELAKP